MLEKSMIPETLSNSHFIEPPDSIKKIVKSFSNKTEIVFFEHPRIQKSCYHQSNIFINIRLTSWRNNSDLMKNPNQPSEVIALRILHELGHIVNEHKESIAVKDGKITQLMSDYKVMKQIQDAWDWAIKIQKTNVDIYDELLKECQIFEENYEYINTKNW